MWEGEVLKRHHFDIVSITLGNGSQIGVWHFRCLLFALVLFCHPNPRGDTMLPSLLINWPDHRPCCFLFCVLFCVVLFVWVLFLLLLCGFLFVLCWLDVLARWKLNGLCIDPYSVPLLVHIVDTMMLPLHYFTEFANMQLAFRIQQGTVL